MATADSDLPILVTVLDNAKVPDAVEHMISGLPQEVRDFFIRTEASHGPPECKVEEEVQPAGQWRCFVIRSNRPVNVLNVSSRPFKVWLDVPSGKPIDHIVHPGGSMLGLYGDEALATCLTGTSLRIRAPVVGTTTLQSEPVDLTLFEQEFETEDDDGNRIIVSAPVIPSSAHVPEDAP
jgi:hypothetical protein